MGQMGKISLREKWLIWIKLFQIHAALYLMSTLRIFVKCQVLSFEN